MRVVMEFLGFIISITAGAWLTLYLSWGVIKAFEKKNDWIEEDYVVTKDGEKIPYDEDTQE